MATTEGGFPFVESSLRLSYEMVSQAEALWESKSQIAGLACQDTRYKGPGRGLPGRAPEQEQQPINPQFSSHREVTLSCDKWRIAAVCKADIQARPRRRLDGTVPVSLGRKPAVA